MTGSIAYFTSLKFRADQIKVCNSLRASTQIIHDHGKPVEPKSNVIYYKKRDMKEAIKDIWNRDVISCVNWLYSLNLSGANDKMLQALLSKSGSQ